MRIKYRLFTLALPLVMLFALVPNYNVYGIKGVSANKMKDNSYKIEIKCNDYRQCEVANVDNGQKAYCGERLLSINTDLGKNIIQVQLFDSPYADEAFAAIYKPWTTYELSGSDNQLRFMYCYTPEHGVLLYIGSDSFKYYKESFRKTEEGVVISVCHDKSDS